MRSKLEVVGSALVLSLVTLFGMLTVSVISSYVETPTLVKKSTFSATVWPAVQSSKATADDSQLTSETPVATVGSITPASTNAASEDTLSPAVTTTTLTTNKTTAWLKSTVVLSGTITATDETTGAQTLLANKPVDIQRYNSDGTWVLLSTITTDEAGTFTFTASVVSVSSQFKAVFNGDGDFMASESAPAKITGFKATTRTYGIGPSKLTAERTVTYYAHHGVYDSRVGGHPAVVGSVIEVFRKDAYGGGSWKRAGSFKTNSNGNIAWRAVVSTPTYWRLVAHSTDTVIYAKSAAYKPQVVPLGKVFRLPSNAPKPTYLAPQRAAVGSGAHPSVSAIPNGVWRNMVGRSWHRGCPIGRGQLSYMTINYWGFDGYRHRGEMVFRSSKRSQFVSAFTKIYNKHIPLHGMYRVDKFGYSSRSGGADDYASMRHDNTSAFNCRWVTGNPGVRSPHSYGTAVDINPFENPYHSARGWTPNYWWRVHHIKPYTWRSRSDTLVYLMTHSGFRWTYGNEDSQHFDA